MAGRGPGGRKVLIVAAEFPPVKGIGRLRPLKMCQHLPGFGWEAAVLTLDEESAEPRDLATLEEIPRGLRVFRAPRPRPVESLITRVKGGGGGDLPGSRAPGGPSGSGAIPGSSGGLRAALGGAKQGWDRLCRRHLMVPDGLALWIPLAVRVGLRACETWRPDVVFATAPPFSDLLVGRTIARRLGIPWVADYRDLWTGDVLREWLPGWRKRFELWLEKRLVSSASAVVAVSEPKEEVLRGRIPRVPAERFFTVTNGFDPEEYEGLEPEGREPGVFRIVYTGRLFKNRRGYEVLEGVGRLLERRPEWRNRVRIEYYGGVAPEIARGMEDRIRRYGLGGNVWFREDVPYARSKALQLGADALLLIVDTGETTSGVLPGKLFEYMAAGRPVLCLAAPGATTRIVEEGRLGWVVEPGDAEGVAKVVESCLNGSGAAGYQPVRDFLAGFERKRLMERLAGILDAAAVSPGAGEGA